ncbi:MAG: hypothetical protein C4576_14235 [Desulfobacteraceae bacterium]|nr:MAG: hypothetical protein C4576_14235 [Desulfobacteraceae bacterium]
MKLRFRPQVQALGSKSVLVERNPTPAAPFILFLAAVRRENEMSIRTQPQQNLSTFSPRADRTWT